MSHGSYDLAIYDPQLVLYLGLQWNKYTRDKPESYPKSSRAKAMAFSMGRDQIEHRQLLVEPPL